MDEATSSLTALEAAQFATRGQLLAKVGSGSTLTDAQIDVLVAEWQKSLGQGQGQGRSTIEVGSSSSKTKGLPVLGSSAEPAMGSKRRSWEDSEDEDLDQHVHVLRASLGEVRVRVG